jgi:hypothetical protein
VLILTGGCKKTNSEAGFFLVSMIGVKSMLPSQWTGIILAALILLSVFMPWVRMQPVDTSGMVEQLAGREDNWVYDYVIMHSRDWRALLKAPSSGVSGYQLLIWAEDETYEGKLARMAAGILWGENNGQFWMRLLIMGPLLGIAGMLVLGIGTVSRRYLLASGAALMLYYLLARWKMASALGNFLVGELVWNIGLWLHLYALLIMGLVLLAKAVNPRARF